MLQKENGNQVEQNFLFEIYTATCDFLLALCNFIFILALTSSWSHVNGEKLVTFVNRCLAIRSHVTPTAILDEKGGKIP